MLSRYAAVHAVDKIAGPGDARPEAQQIITDNELEGKWADKVILVTGVSSGIGIETVKSLATTGARIYAGARSLDKARTALASVLVPGNNVELIELDVASFPSVRAAAASFLAKEKKLNVLINNAGIMAVPRNVTADGNDLQLQTNHLGHFLLFQLLKPALLAASTPAFASRVVNVSSNAHRVSSVVFDDLTLTEYDPWKSYGQSKTANIWMANELDRRYGQQGVHGLSLHPGGILTNLGAHLDFGDLVNRPEVKKTLKNPSQGAATSLVAAVDKELEGKGGLFLSDCGIAEPVDPEALKQGVLFVEGHAPWINDEEGEKKLWKISCELVGVQDDA